jgi:hypothetical protein
MAVQNYGAIMQGAADLTAMPANAFAQGQQRRQAHEYRNALLAQDQQQQAFQQQRYSDEQAQGQQTQASVLDLIDQAEAAFEQGGFEAVRPIVGQLAAYDPRIAEQIAKSYEDDEKVGTLYQTAEGFLPAEQAVGKMPYRAPERPQQAPTGSWSSPFQGVGPDGKPGLYRQHSVSGKVEPLNLGAVPKGGTQQSVKATKEAGLAQSRINAARAATTELDEAMKVLQQSRLFGTGPVAGRLGGMAAPVQRYEAAVRRLFGHIQAITRIPGIGSQSDWEGRMQLLTLPSAEYDESINLQAAGELKQFLQDVEMAYQNAYGESGVAPRGASGSWDEKSSNDGWSVEEQP